MEYEPGGRTEQGSCRTSSGRYCSCRTRRWSRETRTNWTLRSSHRLECLCGRVSWWSTRVVTTASRVDLLPSGSCPGGFSPETSRVRFGGSVWKEVGRRDWDISRGRLCRRNVLWFYTRGTPDTQGSQCRLNSYRSCRGLCIKPYLLQEVPLW